MNHKLTLSAKTHTLIRELCGFTAQHSRERQRRRVRVLVQSGKDTNML